MKKKNKEHCCVTSAEVQAYMNDAFKVEEEVSAFEEKMENCDKCLNIIEGIQNELISKKLHSKSTEAKAQVEHLQQDFLFRELASDAPEPMKVHQNKAPQNKRRRLFNYRVAAILLVLLGVIFLLIINNQNIFKKEPIRSFQNETKKKGLNIGKSEASNQPKEKNNLDNQNTQVPEKVQQKPQKPAVSQNSFDQNNQKKPETDELEAVRVEIRANFENWISDAQINKGGKLTVKTPEKSETIKGQEVVFEMEYPQDSTTLYISIFDSVRVLKPIYERLPVKEATKQKGFYYKKIDNLPAGTYYWRIYDSQQALYISKFYKAP